MFKVVCAAILLVAFSASTRAATYWVSPQGADYNDCLSIKTGCGTPQGALNKGLLPGDTVNILPGPIYGGAMPLYTSPPAIIISGGGGTGASYTSVVTSGAITSATKVSGGANYTSTPAVQITGGGTNYSYPPIPNFSAGTGTGATGAATLTQGVVTSVAITSGGSGYTASTPFLVTFTGGGSGTGALGLAQVSAGGVVTSVTLGGGANAAATATITAGAVSSINITYSGVGTSAPLNITASGAYPLGIAGVGCAQPVTIQGYQFTKTDPRPIIAGNPNALTSVLSVGGTAISGVNVSCVTVANMELAGWAQTLSAAAVSQNIVSSNWGNTPTFNGSGAIFTGTAAAGVATPIHDVIFQNLYVHDFPCDGIGTVYADYASFYSNVVANVGWYSGYQCNGISDFISQNWPAGAQNYGAGNVFSRNFVIGVVNKVPAPGAGFGTLTAASPGGILPAITLLTGGSGYTSVPSVNIVGGGGSGAIAVATISGGVVTGVLVTNQGSGYTSTPQITITGGGGSGATAAAKPPSNTTGANVITMTAPAYSVGYQNLVIDGINGCIPPGTTAQGTFAGSSATLVLSANLTCPVVGTTVTYGIATDGEGLIEDDNRCDQLSGCTTPYRGFTIFINNITAGNGGPGIQCSPGSDSCQVSFNTSYMDNSGLYFQYNSAAHSTINMQGSANSQVYNNVVYNQAASVNAVVVATGGAGTGCVTPPTVTISGGGGSGAVVTANINVSTGSVTGFNIKNGGAYYTSNPAVTVSGGGCVGVVATAGISTAYAYSLYDDSTSTVWGNNLIFGGNTIGSGKTYPTGTTASTNPNFFYAPGTNPVTSNFAPIPSSPIIGLASGALAQNNGDYFYNSNATKSVGALAAPTCTNFGIVNYGNYDQGLLGANSYCAPGTPAVIPQINGSGNSSLH